MSRGRHPDQGRALAEPVARRRGTVHMIAPGKDTLIDLVIAEPGIFAAVTVRRAQRLCAPPPDLEAEFRTLISRVRQLPGGAPVSREIWWYNRDGRFRFFRINETGLMELTTDGSPLPAREANAGKAGKKVTRLAAPAGVPGETR